MNRRDSIGIFGLGGLALLLAGCSTLARNPVPPELTPTATVPGMPDVRAWAGRPNAAMESDFAKSFAQESAADFQVGADGRIRYPHLALSGGGANGAFGAGFLNGWTRTGKRPVFKIVSGVSTGALMAPFAFLGPEFDEALHGFYTTTTTEDLFAFGSVFMGLLRRDSLGDTGPLARLIAEYIDDEMMKRIAAAHEGDRRLYMGTVDLDSQNFVVWNMGLIATSGHPDALDLFRKVMLASASIPIVFPPVMIDVEAGGERYDEMHVDGAVAARVFLNGAVFRPSLIAKQAGRTPGREDLYVIHNGQLQEPPTPTTRSMRGITSRVLDVSGRAGVIGDLFRLYTFAQREQGEFQWVTIGRDIPVPGAEVFDPVSMTALYEVGYRYALEGPVWSTEPPGLREEPVSP